MTSARRPHPDALATTALRPRRRRPALLALGAVVAVLLAACGDASPAGTTTEAADAVRVDGAGQIAPLSPAPTPALPVTVTSADGVEVTVTDASRILAVDLYGTLAETVFSLGLGDRVVGRDTSTGFPEAQHLPLVTVGGHALSAEAVLDLNPTVVLTDTTIGPAEVPRQLRDAGIPVVLFDPTRTIDGVADQIRAVARTLGVPAAGEELAERTQGEIDDAIARAEHADGQRIAFLYLRGSAVSLMGGPGSGADELVTALGAEDAGTAIGLDRTFVQITSEALIGARPDILLLMEGGLASVNGLDGLLKVPGVAQTPAGEHRAVIAFQDTNLLGFGPRTGATLDALAEAVAAATDRQDAA